MTPALQAARDSAAVFLLEHRTHIEITGADRAAFLHNFCTNDIKSLQPGQGCEAFICNVKGHMLGHVTVFVGEDSIWLETVPGAAQKLISHFERYIIREDVELHDRSKELAELIFAGPDRSDAFSRWLISSGHDSLSVIDASLGTGPVRIHRVEWLGTDSELVIGAPDELHPNCVSLGTPADWEALRIDAGFPNYGVDITEDNLPQEVARNDKCLSFTKGCYLGQEPVARLDALGHTNRELRRLLIHSSAVPAHGTGLVDPATDNAAGHITSAAPNPYGDGIVALGYVKSKWFAPGTRLHLATDAKHDVVVR